MESELDLRNDHIKLSVKELFNWRACTKLGVLEIRTILSVWYLYFLPGFLRLRRRSRFGHDRMVVGFATTYAISTYHHWCSNIDQDKVYNIMS